MVASENRAQQEISRQGRQAKLRRIALSARDFVLRFIIMPRAHSVVRLKRKVITVVSLTAPPDDVAYWRAQSPRARWRAMELMRRINYGHAAASGRLQRVLEVAQLSKG